MTDGLSRDYITQFSYDIPETFNLIVPRYMGGGTVEQLGSDSNTYDVIESSLEPIKQKILQNRYLHIGVNNPL